MADLIDRQVAISEILKGTITTSDLYGMGVMSGMDTALERVKAVPAVDAVPADAYKQVQWERDTAIKQLESYGVSFGEKAECKRIVHCKDCKHWRKDTPGCTENVGCCEWAGYMVGSAGYCVYGERRVENAAD